MEEFLSSCWMFLGENWEGISGLSALTLTLIQIYFTRKHNKLSVKPHLGTFGSTTSNNGILKYTHYLTCDGLGPAEIVNFSVFYNNKLIAKNDVESTQTEVQKIIANHYPGARNYVGAYTTGAVIPADRDNPLLILELPLIHNSDLNHAKNFINNFRLVIDYKSFYNEHYTMDSDDFISKEK